MSKEIMQMALDALKLAADTTYSDTCLAVFKEAIEALRQALAQPEQKIVAYWNGQDLIRRAEEVSSVPNWTDFYYIPLYSEPQSKPLIALTDKEIETTFFDMQQYVKVDLKAFARAIEVKLRGKNA